MVNFSLPFCSSNILQGEADYFILDGHRPKDRPCARLLVVPARRFCVDERDSLLHEEFREILACPDVLPVVRPAIEIDVGQFFAGEHLRRAGMGHRRRNPRRWPTSFLGASAHWASGSHLGENWRGSFRGTGPVGRRAIPTLASLARQLSLGDGPAMTCDGQE